MTGVNSIFVELIAWCGGNNILLSACEFGIGFGVALLFGYLCLNLYKVVFSSDRNELSIWHAAWLFACACWGLFLVLLSARLQTLTMGLPAIKVILLAGILVAPISALTGIPFLLLYLIRRPLLQSRLVYVVATLNLVLSFLYLVGFNVAFDGSS